MGKVIGGGATLNRLNYDRGARSDYDAWGELGNRGWSWNELFPYFLRHERFTPPSQEEAARTGATWDMRAHGTNGPIHTSFGGNTSYDSPYFFDAMREFGVQKLQEGNNGNALAAFWCPATIDPRTMTRSYGKTAHYEPNIGRQNFQVLTGHQTTRILFSGERHRANAVEFSTGPRAESRTARARREVILAAGPIGTTRLLQVSGVGPESLLRSLNIPTVVDLPGVGANYQDHALTRVARPFNNSRQPVVPNDVAQALYQTNRTGPLTGNGYALAFIPLNNFTSNARQLVEEYLSGDQARFLPAGTHPTVIEGYNAQMRLYRRQLAGNSMSALEIIFGPASLTVSNRPLSRGTVQITSSDPFVYPRIDLRYLSHPFDLRTMTLGLQFSRRVMAARAFAPLSPGNETVPGPAIQTQEQLENHIRSQYTTINHSSGTCSMLPRRLGGVVDERLRVYGVQGLRIVDASVLPLIPGAHIMATVYAVAERAAEFIARDN
jgi:choline dehydrogenase-like flavoprotein